MSGGVRKSRGGMDLPVAMRRGGAALYQRRHRGERLPKTAMSTSVLEKTLSHERRVSEPLFLGSRSFLEALHAAESDSEVSLSSTGSRPPVPATRPPTVVAHSDDAAADLSTAVLAEDYFRKTSGGVPSRSMDGALTKSVSDPLSSVSTVDDGDGDDDGDGEEKVVEEEKKEMAPTESEQQRAILTSPIPSIESMTRFTTAPPTISLERTGTSTTSGSSVSRRRSRRQRSYSFTSGDENVLDLEEVDYLEKASELHRALKEHHSKLTITSVGSAIRPTHGCVHMVTRVKLENADSAQCAFAFDWDDFSKETSGIKESSLTINGIVYHDKKFSSVVKCRIEYRLGLTDISKSAPVLSSTRGG